MSYSLLEIIKLAHFYQKTYLELIIKQHELNSNTVILLYLIGRKNTSKKCLLCSKLPYPRHCSPGVLFFNMGFWVGVNSKNPPKSGLFKQKVGVYSRKTPKTRLFTLPGAQFKSGAAMTRIRQVKPKHQSIVMRFDYLVKILQISG